jgi:hypothetical protein
MTLILKEVLSSDRLISKGTDFYLDDILVDEDIVSVERVVEHLAIYGLVSKPPEKLENARVLGLQLEKNDQGTITWRRGNKIPDVEYPMTRRQLFSLCGQLVGHYPLAGWLRIACSYAKRVSEGRNWDDNIGTTAERITRDLMSCVAKNDPVRGEWCVEQKNNEGRVWCDASSIGTGVTLELGGKLVEDAAWLRKKDDNMHINIAELEAVLKGVNLALKWDVRVLEVMTDSATVFGWLKSLFTASHRIKMHGPTEMLVKRRLCVMRELTEAYAITISVTLVKSEDNKADPLTRVKNHWLQQVKATCCVSNMEEIRKVHNANHLGVKSTLYLAQQADGETRKEDVELVVRNCAKCQSIDPAPVRWNHGSLGVGSNWDRLACDVTHYGRLKFLTVVDCGPSRFAIWRELQSESAECIAEQLKQIFLERGPPAELLMDNGTAFRSKLLENLCTKWNVRRTYRCAYRPEGNGIVERNHRTVKRMAAKTGEDPTEMVYWYNAVPSAGETSGITPASAIYSYSWKPLRRFEKPPIKTQEQVPNRFNLKAGDQVLMKPTGGKCTTAWILGTVTDINSANNISVNGTPRHVSDLRPWRGDTVAANQTEGATNNNSAQDEPGIPPEEEEDVPYNGSGGELEDEEELEELDVNHRPIRMKKRPQWHADYVW